MVKGDRFIYLPASYTYNGLGQRLQRSSSLSSSVYGYDEAGHLTGDYSGGSYQETVYLGDMPVAVLQPTGTWYVHADYRNTPRQIDNASKQAVWAWSPPPFGDSLPNGNPRGLPSGFTYNWRYPGQYFDPEFASAGGNSINYNGFRGNQRGQTRLNL